MLNDITLGQYFPGNSTIHRLDPRMKLIIAIVYITAIFLAADIYTLSVIFIINILIILLSEIPFIIIIKALKPLIFIIAFTFIINVFMSPGDNPLIEFGFIKIYSDSIIRALFFVIRIVSLVSVTSVFIT